MSAIDPNEIPLLLSTDNEGQEAPSKGPNLTPSDRARRRGKVREGLVHTVVRNRKAVAGLIILAIFVLVALLATVLFPADPSTITSLGRPAHSIRLREAKAASQPAARLPHASTGCRLPQSTQWAASKGAAQEGHRRCASKLSNGCPHSWHPQKEPIGGAAPRYLLQPDERVLAHA